MTTWHGDGIYSKSRTDGDGKPFEQYFVRVFVASKVRVFKAGRTLKSAERERIRVLNDPARAVEKRDQQAQEARDGLTVAQLYKSFTGNYRGRGRTEYYVRVLASMEQAMSSKRVSELTPTDFDAYFRQRRARAGSSTIRKECIAAAKMLKWGRQRGLLTVRPLDDYEKPKEPPGAQARALTYEEEDKLLALLPPLERDIVAWGLDTGMPIGEIESVSWAKIDRAAGVIHAVREKTGKARVIPLSLSKRLTQILDRHPQRIGCPLLFHDLEGKPMDRDKLNGALEAALKSAAVPKVRGALWNLLRKTWTSRIYDRGALPQDEAAWGGHSMAIADKHYRDHSRDTKARASGLLDRLPTVATTVAGNGRSAESGVGR